MEYITSKINIEVKIICAEFGYSTLSKYDIISVIILRKHLYDPLLGLEVHST